MELDGYRPYDFLVCCQSFGLYYGLIQSAILCGKSGFMVGVRAESPDYQEVWVASPECDRSIWPDSAGLSTLHFSITL